MTNTFYNSSIKNLIAIEKQMNTINNFIPNLPEINSSLDKINSVLRSSNILAIQNSLEPYYSMIENINNSVSMPQLTTVSNLINANTRLYENLNLLNRIDIYNNTTETINRNSLEYYSIMGEIRKKSSELTSELTTLADNIIDSETKSTSLINLKKIITTNNFTKKDVFIALSFFKFIFAYLKIQLPDNDNIQLLDNIFDLIIAFKSLIDLFN